MELELFHGEEFIMVVAAKLDNYAVDKDNLQFQAAEDYESFGVEALRDGPDNNRGYLPTLASREVQLLNNDVDCVQRHIIVGEIKARDMLRPSLYNILRNHDGILDDDTVYEEN